LPTQYIQFDVHLTQLSFPIPKVPKSAYNRWAIIGASLL